VESMPVFNGDRPVPMETPGESVGASSDDSSEEEEGGEREKGPDSEATDGESRAPLPRRRSRVLRLSPNDDDEQDGGSSPPIPKKDRTGLISRGSPPAPGRTADAPSASKLPEVDPSSRLSGFKFGRRPLELTGDDP
jgi:hypothetical protein